MLITSGQNREVKFVRELRERKHREEARLFVIEGVRLLEDAVAADAPLDTVYYDPQSMVNARARTLLQRVEVTGIRTVAVAPEVFGKMAGTESPQGVLALARYPSEASLASLDGEDSLLVLADGIRDPGNLGTIIRSADAAGAAGVLVTPGSADVYNPKTVRSTMGSLFHLPIVSIRSISELLGQLKQNKVRLIVGDINTDKLHYQVDYTGPIIICVGSEAEGVNPAVLAAADAIVKIPLLGRAESLNAGVAASILLYEAVRQRQKTISNCNLKTGP